MGGRRDPKGRFRPSMPRISGNTTVESATPRPPSSQNIVSTIVDQATIDAAQIVHPTPHDLTTMTVEDTFKSIVLSTATTTAALSNDQGVKTRGMKKRSLTPMKKITSNGKHNPMTPHSIAAGKRTPAQMTEDNDIVPPDSATPSHKKQKMSPTDTTASRDSTMSSVDTPNTKISTVATTSPAETLNPDTITSRYSAISSINTPNTNISTITTTSPAETLNPDTTTSRDSNMSSVDTPDTKISTVATTSPAETLNPEISNVQQTKSSLKVAARTKSEVQRKRAMDRARRAETRAAKAETLLMLAHNKNPERLKLGVLQFCNEQLASKSEQIEVLGQQVEEREVEIAQQKGRIRSHVDWEKTYKANLAEVKEELKTESALAMDYLKLIAQRDGKIYEQDKTIQKLQGELDGLRTIVTQKDEMIQKMQAEQKSVKGALENI